LETRRKNIETRNCNYPHVDAQRGFGSCRRRRSCAGKTDREGDTLSQDKAAPFIVNFTMVDTNKDGKVSQDEFTDGCAKGLVQEQASKPAESGGGQTPEQPTKQ
jgi:hypothetical protein